MRPLPPSLQGGWELIQGSGVPKALYTALGTKPPTGSS